MKDEVLSKKRKELLQIIDKYGIVTREQIDQFMKISYKFKVDSLKKLEALKFIKTYQLAQGHVHYITKRGSEYIGLNNRGYTSRDSDPNLAKLVHNLRINDCIIQEWQDKQGNDLVESMEIKSEREILSSLFREIDYGFRAEKRRAEKTRTMNRIPDFMIFFELSNGRKLSNAYEVELSHKNRTSLERKLKWYTDERAKGTIDNVTYYYEDEGIKRRVEEKAKNMGLSLFFEPISRP